MFRITSCKFTAKRLYNRQPSAHRDSFEVIPWVYYDILFPSTRQKRRMRFTTGNPTMQRVYELLCGDTTSTHSSTSKMLHYSPLSVFTPQNYNIVFPKIFFKRINTFIFFIHPFRHPNIIFTPLGLLRSHFSFHPLFFDFRVFLPPCPKITPLSKKPSTRRTSTHIQKFSPVFHHTLTSIPLTPSTLSSTLLPPLSFKMTTT